MRRVGGQCFPVLARGGLYAHAAALHAQRLKPMPICPWMLVAEIAGWMGAAAVPNV
jgi:hypothetical protein